MKLLSRFHHVTIFTFLIIASLAITAVSWHRAVKGSSDFDVYYYAAKSVRYGDALYTINHHSTSQSGSPFVYPPFFAFLMAPFTLVPIGVAAVLWNLFNLGLFIGCIQLALRLLPQQLSLFDFEDWRKGLWLAIPVLLIALWFFDNVAMAQVNIFVLFFILLSFYLLREKQSVAAGFALGLAVIVKLVPLLFLPYFVIRREWKFTVGFLFALLPAFLVPTLAVGAHKCVEYHQAWVDETLKDHTRPETLGFYASQLTPSHQNLQAVLFRLLIDWDVRESTGGQNGKRFIFRTPIRLSAKASANVSRIVVLLLAMSLFGTLWLSRNRHHFSVALSLIFCGMVLFAPKVRSHFFIFLLLPICYLVGTILSKERLGTSARHEKKVLAASILIYFLQAVKYMKFLGAGCWSVLILLVYFMLEMWKGGRKTQ